MFSTLPCVRIYGALGMSVSSLHREFTDSLIYLVMSWDQGKVEGGLVWRRLLQSKAICKYDNKKLHILLFCLSVT